MSEKTEKDISEEKPPKEDEFFRNISQLDPAESFVSVFRKEETGNIYCGKLSVPLDLDDIKAAYGGGTFALRAYRVVAGHGAQLAGGFTVSIAGKPRSIDDVPAPVAGAGVNIKDILDGMRAAQKAELDGAREGMSLWKAEIDGLRAESAANTKMMFAMMQENNARQTANDRVFFENMLRAAQSEKAVTANNSLGNLAEIVELAGVLSGMVGGGEKTVTVASVLSGLIEKVGGFAAGHPELLQLVVGKLLSSNVPPSPAPVLSTTLLPVPVADAKVSSLPPRQRAVSDTRGQGASNAEPGEPGGAKPRI